jgi:hypothetical protein
MAKISYEITEIKKSQGFEKAFSVYSSGGLSRLYRCTDSHGQSFIPPAEGLFAPMPRRILCLKFQLSGHSPGGIGLGFLLAAV